MSQPLTLILFVFLILEFLEREAESEEKLPLYSLTYHHLHGIILQQLRWISYYSLLS
jgi:hypothetical protein